MSLNANTSLVYIFQARHIYTFLAYQSVFSAISNAKAQSFSSVNSSVSQNSNVVDNNIISSNTIVSTANGLNMTTSNGLNSNGNSFVF